MKTMQEKILEEFVGIITDFKREPVVVWHASNIGTIYIHKSADSFRTIVKMKFDFQTGNVSVMFNDSTTTIYAEYDNLEKIEAMFNALRARLHERSREA